MSCNKLRSFAVMVVASWVVLSSLESVRAALISHFTFDSDYTNAVSASLDSPNQVGASIDNTTFRVGGGAVLFMAILLNLSTQGPMPCRGLTVRSTRLQSHFGSRRHPAGRPLAVEP